MWIFANLRISERPCIAYERPFNSRISKFFYHLLIFTMSCSSTRAIVLYSLHLQKERSKLADVQLQNLPETCSDQQGVSQPRTQASAYQCHPAFPSQTWSPVTLRSKRASEPPLGVRSVGGPGVSGNGEHGPHPLRALFLPCEPPPPIHSSSFLEVSSFIAFGWFLLTLEKC